MSEPYDGPCCPLCGSTSTWAWLPATAREQGYASQCRDCGTCWDIPSADIPELEHRQRAQPNLTRAGDLA